MERAALHMTFAILLLWPAVAAPQMVSSEESRARRGCISEAERDGWDVRSVAGFRARTGGLFTVQLEVERSRERSQLSCGWDGRRARIDVTDDPWLADERGGGRSADGGWQRDDSAGGGRGRSAADACELALRDEVRAEARRRGFDSGEAHVENEETVRGRDDEERIRGTGSYRFGDDRYRRMTFECRMDVRTRRVLEARWDPEGREIGPDDRAGRARPRSEPDTTVDPVRDARRRLTCGASGSEPRTCPARVAGEVRIVKREEGRCREGSDWWWGPRGITVTNGCRAEFEYAEQR